MDSNTAGYLFTAANGEEFPVHRVISKIVGMGTLSEPLADAVNQIQNKESAFKLNSSAVVHSFRCGYGVFCMGRMIGQLPIASKCITHSVYSSLTCTTGKPTDRK